MKRSFERNVLFFGTFLLLCACFAHGQSITPFTLTGTGCQSIPVDARATVGIYVSGSWSGTIQPQVTLAGQPPVNAQVKPSTSTTAQSTVTANGAYTAGVSGYSTFVVCGATITGTANVFVNVSPYIH